MMGNKTSITHYLFQFHIKFHGSCVKNKNSNGECRQNIISSLIVPNEQNFFEMLHLNQIIQECFPSSMLHLLQTQRLKDSPSRKQ